MGSDRQQTFEVPERACPCRTAKQIAAEGPWGERDVLTFATEQVPWMRMEQVADLLTYCWERSLNPFDLANALRIVRKWEAAHAR